MRIESIELDNIRSYDSEKVEFEDGLVLLYGDNGAGKSSLLSSIFSGLYMSDVLKYMDGDINLDSLVRRECDEGSINLRFGINGDTYEVDWVISVRDNDGERQASSKSCTLTGSSLNEPIEGVRDVKDGIIDITGLKPESFVNSVYVQQGDITRMVNASDEKRKEIIDGLLGLSKLDDYRDRMDKARLEFGAQRRRINDLLDDKQRQLDEHPSKKDLEREISDKESELEDLKNKKEEVNKTVDRLQKKVLELEQDVEKFEETAERQKSLEGQVEEKNEKRKQFSEKKDQLETEIDAIETELSVLEEQVTSKRENLNRVSDSLSELRTDIEELEDQLTEMDSSITRIEDVKIENLRKDISQKQDDVSDLRVQVESNENRITELKSKKNTHENELETLQSELDDLRKRKNEKESSVNEIADRLGISYQNIQDLQTDVIPQEREQQVERTIEVCTEVGRTEREKELYRELVEDGRCPVCHEEHDDLSQHTLDHYDQLEETVESEDRIRSIRNQKSELDKLDNRSNEIKSLQSDINIKKRDIEEKENEIDRISDRIEDLNSEIDDIEDSISESMDEISELESEQEEFESELDKMKSDRADIAEKRDSLESLISLVEDVQDLKDDIEDRKDNISKYEEMRQNAQEAFLEKKQELNQVEDKIKEIDVEKSKEKKEEFNKKLSKLRNTRDNINNRVSDLQEAVASKRQSLERVEEIKSDIRQLESRKIDAGERETEAEKIIQSYEMVKSNLREENIGLLNKYSNDIFNSVYDNQVYQKMKISKEYDITLVTGDGVEVDPKDLSGGERTIVSLSIRAGVYKLLVERNGNADTLPPFILDEPTTYLDDSHVSNLQDVIETITSWDVPQVLIVSHKEDMIQNADSGYRIEKDPITETSSVTKQY